MAGRRLIIRLSCAPAFSLSNADSFVNFITPDMYAPFSFAIGYRFGYRKHGKKTDKPES